MSTKKCLQSLSWSKQLTRVSKWFDCIRPSEASSNCADAFFILDFNAAEPSQTRSALPHHTASANVPGCTWSCGWVWMCYSSQSRHQHICNFTAGDHNICFALKTIWVFFLYSCNFSFFPSSFSLFLYMRFFGEKRNTMAFLLGQCKHFSQTGKVAVVKTQYHWRKTKTADFN